MGHALVQGVDPQLVHAAADLPAHHHFLQAFAVHAHVVHRVDGGAVPLQGGGGPVAAVLLQGEEINFQGPLRPRHPEKGDGGFPLAVPVQVLELDGGDMLAGIDLGVLHHGGILPFQGVTGLVDALGQILVAWGAFRQTV